jgi:hypothetical protein
MEEIIKFIRIKCGKCNEEISKVFTMEVNVMKLVEGAYGTKLYNLKGIYLTGKTKVKKQGLHSYLYEDVKCSFCDSKVGKYISSTTKKMWDMIESVFLSCKIVKMYFKYYNPSEEYESIKEPETENAQLKLKMFEKFLKHLKTLGNDRLLAEFGRNVILF